MLYINFIRHAVCVPYRCDDDEECCESDDGEAECCEELGVVGYVWTSFRIYCYCT